MNKNHWHKRYHTSAITGYMGLSLEERGAYSTLLDHLYDRGAPLPGNIRLIAGLLDVSVRKATAVLNSLVEKGKITRLPDGRLTNDRFAKEVEIVSKTSDHMAEIGKIGGDKSGLERKSLNEIKVAENVTLASRSSYLELDSELDSKKKKLPLPKGNGREEAPGLFLVPEKRKPPQADLRKQIYDRGKEVFGPTAGGIITNLLKAKDDKPAKVLAMIEDAAEKRDPVAWINAWLWEYGPPGISVGRMAPGP